MKPAIHMVVLATTPSGISSPIFNPLLVAYMPARMAALLYLGVGFGMLLSTSFRASVTKKAEARLTKKELPVVVGMVSLDQASPIFLMIAHATTPAIVA